MLIDTKARICKSRVNTETVPLRNFNYLQESLMTENALRPEIADIVRQIDALRPELIARAPEGDALRRVPQSRLMR